MSNICIDRLKVGYEAGINAIPSLGTVQSLLSSLNLSNSTVEVDSVTQSGKIYQAVVRYMNHVGGDPLTTDFIPGQDYCDMGGKEYTSATYTLDGKVRRSASIQNSDFVNFCEGRNESVNAVINNLIPSVVTEINKQLRLSLAAGAGATLSGVGMNANALVATATGVVPSYDWILGIEDEYALQSALGQYIIVGANNVRKYGTLTGIACCNLNGLNMSNTAENMFFDQTFGKASDVLTYKPGAAQFLNYNQYGSASEFSSAIFSPNGNPTKLFTTVDVEITPGTVISLDLAIVQDPCGTSWNITLEKIFGLYTAATDVVAAGYNNIFYYEALAV